MSFTIFEYIQQQKLDVDPRDTAVMKVVAAHLRELGYQPQRVRRSLGDGKMKSEQVWVKNDRKEMLADLEAKLAVIRKKEGKK
jgi:hypothetical protein